MAACEGLSSRVASIILRHPVVLGPGGCHHFGAVAYLTPRYPHIKLVLPSPLWRVLSTSLLRPQLHLFHARRGGGGSVRPHHGSYRGAFVGFVHYSICAVVCRCYHRLLSQAQGKLVALQGSRYPPHWKWRVRHSLRTWKPPKMKGRAIQRTKVRPCQHHYPARAE